MGVSYDHYREEVGASYCWQEVKKIGLQCIRFVQEES